MGAVITLYSKACIMDTILQDRFIGAGEFVHTPAASHHLTIRCLLQDLSRSLCLLWKTQTVGGWHSAP